MDTWSALKYLPEYNCTSPDEHLSTELPIFVLFKITTMKTTLLVFILFFSSASLLLAQTPEWQWSKRVGGSELDIGRAVKADASGNIYVTGSYNSATITFGDVTLSSSASSSVFLVKYNAAGNVIWAATSEGTGIVDVNHMAIDSDGNILLAGKFSSLSLIFGTTTLASVGSDDAFLVKFDSNGNVLWAKSAGSSAVDRILGVACDTDGNTYATGNFSGTTINFGGASVANTNNNWLYSFLVKYDPDGNALWASGIGGNGQDWSRVVAVDNNGDVIVAGEHSSDVFSAGSISLTNEDGPDVFIAKFDNAGNAIWAKSGIANSSTCQAIAVDSNNQIYITGSFSNETIVFDNITLNNTGQLSYSEFFLAKFDSEGNTLWARSSMGDNQEEGRALAFDASENICVAGFFIDSTALFENINLENMGMEDSFVAEYNSDGDLSWVISIGAGNSDYTHAMGSDPLGHLYVTGFFDSGLLSFGEHDIYTSNSGWDIFVAKLGDDITGLNNTSFDAMRIFPNPYSDRCTIQLSKPMSNGSLIVENTLGQRILQMNNIQGTHIILDRNNLKSGTYFLHVTEDQKMITRGTVVVMD